MTKHGGRYAGKSLDQDSLAQNSPAKNSPVRGSFAQGSFAQDLIDESPDALVALSLDGRILAWNRGAETIFGYAAAEAVGKPIDELVVPDDRRAEARQALADVIERGTVLFETIRRHKDGALIDIDSTMRVVKSPAGQPTFIAVSKKDVTQLKRLRDQQAMDATFLGLLDAAPDATVIVGQDGSIRLVNEQVEKLFGYEREELLGKPIEILVPERFHPGHPAHRNGYIRDPRPRPMGMGLDLSARRKDGSEFPAEISLAPVSIAEGVLVSAAIRDVTERKRAAEIMARAKEAAETANRELEAFSYSVAHDLRAPLRGIDGFSLALLEDHSEQLDAEGREFLTRVRESARFMAQLIDSLLMLAQVTQSELRRERVDLSRLAAGAVARFQSEQPERRTEIVIADGLIAHGDGRLLGIALDNLIGNAWKFTAKRPKARIAFGRGDDGGQPAYFVSDDGAGFDMAYASKLFGVFQRLHTPNEFEGTGIGLATVERIIRRHGGRIWARGQVNRGATFFFTLDDQE
jgi:PAS domain S-box-containing protein